MPKILLDDGVEAEFLPPTERVSLNSASAIVRSADGDSDDNRRVRVIVTTQQPDRAGDVIVTSGIQIENYLKNPVVLLQHRADSPIARCVELQIFGDRMEAVAEFPPAGVSAQADQTLRLVRAKILNAVSIGLNPLEGGVEWLDPAKPMKGLRYTKTDMLEFSFVAMPMNPGALVLQRSFGEAINEDDLSAFQALASELVPKSAPEAPELPPELSQPPCTDDPDAIRLKALRLRSVEVYRRRHVLTN